VIKMIKIKDKIKNKTKSKDKVKVLKKLNSIK